MEVTQMNVRMDRSVKRAGDAVLATLGCTPSQAVRALWGYLVSHAALPAELDHLLRQGALDEGADEPARDVRLDGERMVAEFYERIGAVEPSWPAPSYEAMREEWATERLAEWGLS